MMSELDVTPIASRRHTAILVSVFVLFAIAGGVLQHDNRVEQVSLSESEAIQLYLSALIVDWASVYYVWKGTRRHVTLSSLVGGRWQTPGAVVTDIVIAAALWALWMGVELALPDTNSVHSLLPHTPLELIVWMPVAVSAGFCEELVFRGYFQRQFHALTGSVAVAVALQAVVFGAGHFYEGTWAVVKITLYGVLFGMLAAWRKSLRPGMLAHAWSDIFAVL
jgi:membrane protease YdiL (CAAX protease family)